MKWCPPLFELSRTVARCVASLSGVDAVRIVAILPLVSGCSALPVMQSAPVHVAMSDAATDSDDYSDAEKLRRSQLPVVPDFDVHVPPEKREMPNKVSETARLSGPVVVAAMPPSTSSPQPSRFVADSAGAHSTSETPAIAGAGLKGIELSQAPSPVQLPTLRIDAPKPFAWTPMGKSSGNRSFQSVTIGDEGYRTLVIGSVAGDDPLAVELTEQLARRLHDGKTVLGGFQSTVIRTLNPDGEALGKILNEKGQYINHGFPKDNGIADADQPLEVTFLLGKIQSLQPQRLVHIRTIDSAKGVIAASSGCTPVASDAAEWLGFRVIGLPETAVSGSLERHLASAGRCEVLTFAIPAATKKNELWERYGDALQNLLVGEDVTSRELANKKTKQSSANSRNADDK